MRNFVAVILAALPLLSLAGNDAGAQQQQQPRESAIVGGHRIQPRADAFSGEHVTPDVPPAEAKDLNVLYQKILRDSAAPTGSGDVADPGAASPDGTTKPR